MKSYDDENKDQDHINSSDESGKDQHEKIKDHDKNNQNVETDFNVNHDDENIENIEEDINVDENEEEQLPEESIMIDENINNIEEDINVDENGAEQLPDIPNLS